MIYPYQGLPENLAAFCAVLRREHGFRVGPRELQDAARAIEISELSDERAVRDALRPVLSGSLDDVRVFDRVFEEFFHGASGGAPPRDALAAPDDRRAPLQPGRAKDRASPGREPSSFDLGSDAGAVDDAGEGAGAVHEVSDLAAGEPAGLLRGRYSPLEAEGEAVLLAPADDRWRQAAAVLVGRVQRGLSRRWTPAAHGARFDVRRSLRTSLHTGGDVVMPRWRTRPRRRPRFVLLIDGSRSMAPHAGAALAAAVALTSVTMTVETFTFSTALRRVTRDVRRAAAGERRRLPPHRAWGGGTAIGACLREFLQNDGDRLLTRDTVVIVESDGLDVGNPSVLRDAMARLSRRSAGVLWFNPLADTPGYQPTAAGMSAARPFVTRLAAVNDAAALMRVARATRL